MPWSRRARLSSCHLLFGLIPPEGSFGDDAEAGHIIYNRTLLDFDAVGGPAIVTVTDRKLAKRRRAERRAAAEEAQRLIA